MVMGNSPEEVAVKQKCRSIRESHEEVSRQNVSGQKNSRGGDFVVIICGPLQPGRGVCQCPYIEVHSESHWHSKQGRLEGHSQGSASLGIVEV